MEAPPLAPSEPTTPPPAPSEPTMSLVARLMNVFAVPGDVFSEIQATRHSAANWLVPILISGVIGAVAVIITFSQPAIQQQIREAQSKGLEQQVKAGKMTQEQADKAQEVLDKVMSPMVMKIAGAIGAAFVGALRVVWWAFVLWLLGRFLLKIHFDYSKSLEVAGLSMMISVLAIIVTMLLQIILARVFASPSLALVLDNFDATRKSHLFLGAANPFSLWQVCVLAIGLSKLANVPFLRAGWPVLTYWVIQESLLILLGFGQLAL